MMQPHRVEQVKTRSAETGLGYGLAPGFVRTLYGVIIDEACRRETSIIEGADAAAPAGSARDE
jgi:chorismate mutase